MDTDTTTETTCDGCGEVCDVLDLKDTDHYGTLCIECWEVAAEADPVLYWEAYG